MPYIPGSGRLTDVFHSENVFANFVPIALWQNPQGAEAAVLSAISAPTYAVDSATIELDGETNETVVAVEQAKLVANGTVTQAEIDTGNTAGGNPKAADTATVAPQAGNTEGSVTLAASVDDTLLYESPLTGIKYYVKTVTKQPGVVFPYDVATVAPANGITVQEMCNNLRLLVINVIDPIKKQYPDAFVTNTIRNKGNGSPTSQHPLGQACDIQYSKATKEDYFTRAQWIRDNISYDQFLLEYKTTGSKNPWHHISFGKSNRAQVCTFMNDKNCKGPGVTGLYDLSNA